MNDDADGGRRGLHDGHMDSRERLEIGLHCLGRVHTALRELDVGSEVR